jgi:hypothetical protein
VKKYLFIALALTLTLASCNKTAFLKKLVGTWKMDRYLFDGQDRTLYFDTTFRGFELTLDEGNIYTESYSEFILTPGSAILTDTLGYDSVNMVYVINTDTLNYIDTTIIPHLASGEWQLINSDEDLQLRDGTTNDARIFRILDLDKNNLKLRLGNEEFYYGK